MNCVMWLYFIFIMLFLFYPSFYLCVMFVSSAVSASPCFRTLPLPPLLPPYLVRAEPKTGWAKQGGQHHDDDDDDNDTHTHSDLVGVVGMHSSPVLPANGGNSNPWNRIRANTHAYEVSTPRADRRGGGGSVGRGEASGDWERASRGCWESEKDSNLCFHLHDIHF